MGKEPAVIIIARHGARLDAVNPKWHLTSPTPYDPPLTYGGWNQSRALGLRIGAFLEQRQDIIAARTAAAASDSQVSNGSTTTDNGVTKPKKKKKYKVFVHSSPFKRCIQTGIGVSAGLSQYQGIQTAQEIQASRPRSSSSLHSPRLHSVDDSVLHARNHLRKALRDQQKQDNRTTLRVDAYLGEWLSPGYFENITEPPPSTLMVASAKAELVRREALAVAEPSAKTPQGNLWASRGSEASLATKVSDGPLDMRQLAHTLPARDRTASYSSGRISPFGRPAVPRARSNEPKPVIGYVAPVPTFAVSSSEAIPKGYVTHARDACVDVDNQWDSMREPLMWGDGGEFGEEWSAMHKRIRKGINNLVEWYETHGTHNVDDYDEAVTGGQDEPEQEETDEDIVVVLITHGAGCNALIGALTEQPVLLDVGMASLTMLFRKDDPRLDTDEVSPKASSPTSPTSPSSPALDRPGRRHGSLSTGLSQKYEMKIVASTDHLRHGADPARPSTPAPVSPMLAAAGTIPDSRKRFTQGAHAFADAPIEPGWAVPDYPRGGVSAALGSIRRLSTQLSAPPPRSGSMPVTAPPVGLTGLWEPPTSTSSGRERSSLSHEITEADLSAEPDSSIGNKLGITYVPDNAHHASIGSGRKSSPRTSNGEGFSAPALATVDESPRKESTDRVSALPRVAAQPPTSLGRTLSQKGLWGSAPSGNYERDRTPKRRWTLQQNNDAP